MNKVVVAARDPNIYAPVVSVVVGFEEDPNKDAPDVDAFARRLVDGILAFEPMLDPNPNPEVVAALALDTAVEKSEFEGRVASKSNDDAMGTCAASSTEAFACPDECLGSLNDVEFDVYEGVVTSEEP